MIGRVISGRYTVESLIGSGGMANVYKAHDNMLNRTVALKVLKEEHRGDMEFVRRFERAPCSAFRMKILSAPMPLARMGI